MIPDQDIRVHDIRPNHTCWCEPATHEDHPSNVLFHNSADGREAYERNERKPS